jgi:hypothetical protein
MIPMMWSWWQFAVVLGLLGVVITSLRRIGDTLGTKLDAINHTLALRLTEIEKRPFNIENEVTKELSEDKPGDIKSMLIDVENEVTRGLSDVEKRLSNIQNELIDFQNDFGRELSIDVEKKLNDIVSKLNDIEHHFRGGSED